MIVIGLSVVVSSAACDRNTEAFVEGEKPRAPDLARIFPQSDPSEAGRGVESPLPAAPQRGVPPSVAPRAGSGSSLGSGSSFGSGSKEMNISGTIRVSGALEGSVPAQGMLFVIARPAGVTAGPPLAVLRIPAPRFPVAFEIGPANVMIPSMRFQGDIGITVRLDSDGNAMTKLPGDLEGTSKDFHKPGASGVEIVLETRL